MDNHHYYNGNPPFHPMQQNQQPGLVNPHTSRAQWTNHDVNPFQSNNFPVQNCPQFSTMPNCCFPSHTPPGPPMNSSYCYQPSDNMQYVAPTMPTAMNNQNYADYPMQVTEAGPDSGRFANPLVLRPLRTKSGASTSSRTSKCTTESEEEKKARRREENRLSQQKRDRKKQCMEELEKEIERLTKLLLEKQKFIPTSLLSCGTQTDCSALMISDDEDTADLNNNSITIAEKDEQLDQLRKDLATLQVSHDELQKALLDEQRRNLCDHCRQRQLQLVEQEYDQIEHTSSLMNELIPNWNKTH